MSPLEMAGVLAGTVAVIDLTALGIGVLLRLFTAVAS